MAKQNKEASPEAGFESIEQNLGRAEQFIEKNSKILTYSFLGVIAVILIGVAYNRYILKPQQEEAFDSIFHAEAFFRQDSLDKALNGDGTHMGFLEIIDQFGSTPSGSLANYYAGICYMKMGAADTTGMSATYFEDAIKHLKKFDGEDAILAPIAIGRQGDAYMELGDMQKAASLYEKAARTNDNNFSAPDFLKRAAMTHALLGDHQKALDLYKEIKEKHHKSFEAGEIEKFIALEEAKLK